MNPVPAPPGGGVSGNIRINGKADLGPDAVLTLTCLKTVSNYGRRNNNSYQTTLHSQTLPVTDAVIDDAGTLIPVEFSLPPTADTTFDSTWLGKGKRATVTGINIDGFEFETGAPRTTGIKWILECRGKTSWVGFSARFVIPVFEDRGTERVEAPG